MFSKCVCVPLMCCEMDVDIRLFVIGSRESWSSRFWGKKSLEGPGEGTKQYGSHQIFIQSLPNAQLHGHFIRNPTLELFFLT